MTAVLGTYGITYILVVIESAWAEGVSISLANGATMLFILFGWSVFSALAIVAGGILLGLLAKFASLGKTKIFAAILAPLSLILTFAPIMMMP